MGESVDFFHGITTSTNFETSYDNTPNGTSFRPRGYTQKTDHCIFRSLLIQKKENVKKKSLFRVFCVKRHFV